MPLDKKAWSKIIFLFLNQNICCGYSKEPSQWDGSFEHPQHMFKWTGKKIITFFVLEKILSFWTYHCQRYTVIFYLGSALLKHTTERNCECWCSHIIKWPSLKCSINLSEVDILVSHFGHACVWFHDAHPRIPYFTQCPSELHFFQSLMHLI